MNIAYVEDNVSNIALLERICHMSKDSLNIYLDAQTAYIGIAANPCDLVIIDLHLGANSLTGLDLAQSLRDNGFEQPIIAVTSYDHIFRDQYMQAGCNEYIRKPISVEKILDIIAKYRH